MTRYFIEARAADGIRYMAERDALNWDLKSTLRDLFDGQVVHPVAVYRGDFTSKTLIDCSEEIANDLVRLAHAEMVTPPREVVAFIEEHAGIDAAVVVSLC